MNIDIECTSIGKIDTTRQDGKSLLSLRLHNVNIPDAINAEDIAILYDHNTLLNAIGEFPVTFWLEDNGYTVTRRQDGEA